MSISTDTCCVPVPMAKVTKFAKTKALFQKLLDNGFRKRYSIHRTRALAAAFRAVCRGAAGQRRGTDPLFF